ncbi:SDR family NAD(P)-dependent oxidoreductase [Microbulbifer thermotolerans]|uniref:SDR family NAD(P)-dependent oxidoreductase n=1 Tax=Microbulbifer thermotolerans TaxID=252514 RepID=UPI00224B6C99|nr:SDR family oxidoreductase [Microbulbifer thermotolerans]MCX2834628.1 SDR family oxidoreductase [Microbulbifer thermotolerans]
MERDPLLDFKGRVALITGAAGGLGAGLARQLGIRGAQLILGDIDERGVQEVARELEAEGIAVRAQRCDVSVESDCAALVELALSQFGSLDIAVNNAGIAPPMQALETVDAGVLEKQHNVNVKGVYFCLKHQLKAMKPRRSGIILNVSSMAGLGAAPKAATYSAAKHAVIGLTRTAAVENAKYNIRVNAVCPFFTLTRMVTDLQPPEGVSGDQMQAYLASGCPMKRLAEPREVVNAMLFFCSPALTYITGQALAVDGGVSAF